MKTKKSLLFLCVLSIILLTQNISLLGVDKENPTISENDISFSKSEKALEKPEIQISAVPVSGLPPLEVQLKCITKIRNPITKYEWDFEGDEEYDWSSTTNGNISHVYERTGIFKPTVRITASTQDQFTATETIYVHLPAIVNSIIPVNDPVDLAIFVNLEALLNSKIDPQFGLYVLQKSACQINKYNHNGDLLTTLGSQGKETGQFESPCGIAVDLAGSIYIADTGNNRVQKLTPGGRPDMKFGNNGVLGINVDNNNDGVLDSGNKAGEFCHPYGVAVDENGNVYVTDTGNNRIQKFDHLGRFIEQWLGFGGTRHHFSNPKGMIHEFPLGDLFIVDAGYNRVVKLSTAGTTWEIFDLSDNNKIMCKSLVDVGESVAYIYIADADCNKIIKIGKQEQGCIQIIDMAINGESLYKFSKPSAIALDPIAKVESIYVVDNGNNNILRIELPKSMPIEDFSEMKKKLSEGDIEGAVKYFTQDSREKYQMILKQIKADLPEVVEDMKDMHPISVGENYAEFIIVRKENGEECGYFVTFTKNKEGKWEIAEM